MSYDMIDRFLRNNLGDDDYAEYSAALDAICAQPVASEPSSGERAELLREFENAVDHLARLHVTHMGKAMSDEKYGTFTKLRDETIPNLRAALLSSDAKPASESRNVTKEEDAVLRRAAMSASTIVHPGRLASEPVAVPQGWQPIETAPKDEAVLLASGDYVGEGFWHDGSECYGHRGKAGWFWAPDRSNLLIASNANASHWMPLPAAPSPAPVGINGLIEAGTNASASASSRDVP